MMFDYLAANKRRATLDINGVTDLISANADIVIYDNSVEHCEDLLNADVIAETQCVVAVVTPFGMNSPYSGLHSDELLYFALSGIASTTPEGAEDRSYERPMGPFGHQASFIAGVVAATAALQAFTSAKTSGMGRLLDVAVVDAVAATPIISQAKVFGGHVADPNGQLRIRSVPFGALRCADGYIYLMGRDWDGLAEAGSRATLAMKSTDSLTPARSEARSRLSLPVSARTRRLGGVRLWAWSRFRSTRSEKLSSTRT